MAPTLLHVLSQRPGLTGSGVTLEALVRGASRSGWNQHIVVGVPADEPLPPVGDLPADRVHPVLFGYPPFDYPVPGMSDVMPYPSSVFRRMTEGQLAAYRGRWKSHLAATIARTRPSLIHCHHVWIVSSLLPEIAAGIPVVAHCHATGLRQMRLCPHLAGEVRAGCSRLDEFVALHRGHAEELAAALGVPAGRIHVVGAGYRDDVFHARDREAPARPRILYVGKWAASKGVPWLLDAFERLRARDAALELHLAGTGTGPEAAALERRMRATPSVVLHGQLDPPGLADLMRRSRVCVLPSFYEGLPLVLVEAMACGCSLVATRLPGIVESLAQPMGDALELVDLPRLRGPDDPEPGDRPRFVDNLTRALAVALEKPLAVPDPETLRPFGWDAVFARVEAVWRRHVPGSSEAP